MLSAISATAAATRALTIAGCIGVCRLVTFFGFVGRVGSIFQFDLAHFGGKGFVLAVIFLDFRCLDGCFAVFIGEAGALLDVLIANKLAEQAALNIKGFLDQIVVFAFIQRTLRGVGFGFL
ncbi:MAG: hypothetical protein WAU43_11395, partial [Acidobacteriaceae bacterium]